MKIRLCKYLFLFLATGVVSSCLKEDTLKAPFDSFDPVEIQDGHHISTPTLENMDSLALVEVYKDVIEDDNLWSLKSMLVFRNGHLVAENYFKDQEDIVNKDLIWSCTKQFMGVLVGKALEEGMIDSIDDPMSKYMPEAFAGHPDKSDITIRNFITMRSGIGFSNDGVSGQTDKLLRQIPENSVDFVLDLPVNDEQGTVFHYNDGDPNLISAMIQEVAGKPTDEWADEVIFSKIGFENYSWTRYPDGITFGGFGIKTTPRELAKFAMLVADKGTWNGEPIVSESWINDMISEQVDVNDDYAFGYYWWINKERNIHHMWGHGGQFAFIAPHKDLIVVLTSIPNTQGDHQINAFEAFEYVDRIVELCD
ncbi:MAG: class C beta-lactamase-related serine hydrolase [Bacteroidetes bacterium]|nr:MAG: class C beta-lactamase-related serine hydrolase [Bacteroidota bacterium]